jgi:hypothetical protein
VEIPSGFLISRPSDLQIDSWLTPLRAPKVEIAHVPTMGLVEYSTLLNVQPQFDKLHF